MNISAYQFIFLYFRLCIPINTTYCIVGSVTSLWPSLSIGWPVGWSGWSIGWLVDRGLFGWLVARSVIIFWVRKVTLSFFHRSTCWMNYKDKVKTEVQRVREDANDKCYTTIHYLNSYQSIFYFNHYYVSPHPNHFQCLLF